MTKEEFLGGVLNSISQIGPLHTPNSTKGLKDVLAACFGMVYELVDSQSAGGSKPVDVNALKADIVKELEKTSATKAPPTSKGAAGGKKATS